MQLNSYRRKCKDCTFYYDWLKQGGGVVVGFFLHIITVSMSSLSIASLSISFSYTG